MGLVMPKHGEHMEFGGRGERERGDLVDYHFRDLEMQNAAN